MTAENQRNKTTTGGGQNIEDGVIQIDLLGLVRRRWGLIAFAVVLFTALATFYFLTATTIYESTTEILVIPKDTKLATTTATSNADLGLQSAGDELLATHMKIITSPAIIEKAMVESQFMALESIKAEARKNDDELVTTMEYIIDYIRENLVVERGGSGSARDAQVLTARFKHTEPRDSAAILLAICDQYRTYIGETVKGAGGQAAELITTASVDLSNRLKETDSEYEDFLLNAPLLWSNDGTHTGPQQARIVRLEDELTLLRQQKTKTASRLQLAEAALANAGDEPDPLAMLSVFDGADIERLSLLLQVDRGYPASEAFQSQLPAASVESGELLALNLEAERVGLLYGANHPKARELRQQISEVKSYLDQKNIPTGSESAVRSPALDVANLVPLYKALLTVDLADLTTREESLLARLEREQETAREMITTAIKADSLKREIDRTQQLYDVVLARVGEINLLTDYGGFITDMLSPPRVGEKAWPKGSLILPAGVMLGLFFGGGLAVVAELMDHSFRTPKDVESELGVPVISHISKLRRRAVPKGELSNLAPTMVTLHSPKSRDAEAFRTLRTTLMFNAGDVPCPILQMTSPNPGDGKSTIACNLATSIAQAGKSIVLVDADMRRPMVHKNLGIEQAPGLSELLGSVARLDDVIHPLASAPNLSVIPSGAVPTNPAELLSSSLLGELLDELRSRFDWILIDSPPVNAVSDPLVLAPHADSVILALTLGSHARTAAQQACRQLGDVGANLNGLIINRTSGDSSGYGYSYSHYDYRYNGGYGSSSSSDAYYGEGVST